MAAATVGGWSRPVEDGGESPDLEDARALESGERRRREGETLEATGAGLDR